MDVKPGYKQTEVGVIPEDWEEVPITSLIDRRTNITYGVVQPGKNDPDGVLFVRGGDVYGGKILFEQLRRIPKAVSDQYSRTRLSGGEILIGLVGYPGEVALVPPALAGANIARQVALVKLDPDRPLCHQYVCIFLGSSTGRRQLLKEAIGSAQQVINLRDIKNVAVALPPDPNEQRAIASALSDVDGLLGALDRLIAKKRDLKQAAMQQLLTGQTRLPGFTGEWETKAVGQIAQLYQPTTISSSKLTKDGYPVYGANGVVGFYHSTNHTSWQVLVTCRGSTCGTVNRTVDECWITGNAMVLNCDHNPAIGKDFFYYLMLSQDMSDCITGTGQPQIVRSPLSAFQVSLPRSLDEQTDIAKVLSDMDAELAALEQRRDKTRAIKQGMMQELLTGRTRLL